MLAPLSAYIAKHDLLHPGDRLGLAVSGGADSVALLRAVLELRDELGLVLSVVHFHHGIRGDEADADESFVAELAHAHNLPFLSDRADVPRFAKENSLSLEAAARKLRYEFFVRLIRENALDKIATAHTSDDQAETVLLRFLRGSGTRGLAGIHPVLKVGGGQIVRPMLETSRAQVLAYLHSLGQPWREDATNADLKHTRNRLRHKLLPLLESEYNFNLRQLLGEFADAARDEEEYWSHLISEVAGKAIDEHGPALRIHLEQLQSPAIRRRLLRLAAERLGLRLDFHHVEQLLALAALDHPAQLELPRNFRARRPAPGLITLELASPASSPAGYDHVLSIPSEVYLASIGTRVLVTKVRYTVDKGRYNPDSLLDAALLRPPLRLRNWRPGDRIRLLHRGSEEKLKRLFQEKHVPAEQRALWPVLTSEERVVWAKDFPVSAEFAARENTLEAVLIEASKL